MIYSYLLNKLSNKALWLYMIYVRHLLWNPFIEKTHNPQKVQIRLLKEILKANGSTYYGINHKFSEIKSYEDFCRQIPVQTYEDLRDLIEKQEKTREPFLCKDPPLMYTLTSGTTGRPKYIPVQERTIKSILTSNHKVSPFRDSPQREDWLLLKYFLSKHPVYMNSEHM